MKKVEELLREALQSFYLDEKAMKLLRDELYALDGDTLTSKQMLEILFDIIKKIKK